MTDYPILDGNVASVREKAARLPIGELQALLVAERNGKTRKGAIAVLEELIDLAQPEEPIADDEPPGSVVEIPPGLVLFTNDTEATCIHLGDGRKLAPGASAAVTPELLAILKP